MLDRTRIESVSMGAGVVRYRVVLPAMKKRPRSLASDYETLQSACVAVKQCFQKDDVDPETVAMVEDKVPDGSWGQGS